MTTCVWGICAWVVLTLMSGLIHGCFYTLLVEARSQRSPLWLLLLASLPREPLSPPSEAGVIDQPSCSFVDSGNPNPTLIINHLASSLAQRQTHRQRQTYRDRETEADIYKDRRQTDRHTDTPTHTHRDVCVLSPLYYLTVNQYLPLGSSCVWRTALTRWPFTS